MKRSILTLLVGVAIMLGLSMTAFANTATVTFIAPSGTSFGGVFTGVYSGALDGKATSFVCDDPNHILTSGQSWLANIFSLSTVGTAGNGMFSGPPSAYTATADGIAGYTPQEVYNSVGWLADQILKGSTSDVNGAQFAIWELTSGPDLSWTGPGSTASWIALGLSHDNYENSSLWFATPTVSSGPRPLLAVAPAQEFIFETKPVP